MAKDEEYELMPHQTIAKIKHELEILKRKAGTMKEVSTKEFQSSMDNLNNNINNLLSLFKEAAQNIDVEEEPGIKEQIDPLSKRVARIEDENSKIAEGILVIADMIKELKEAPSQPKTEPAQKPFPKPVFRQQPPQPKEKPPFPEMIPPKTAPGPEFGRPPMPPPSRMPSRTMSPMPPPRPMAPSPIPPMPEIRAPPKKQGFFSKLLKK
jgi:hypothetical protein